MTSWFLLVWIWDTNKPVQIEVYSVGGITILFFLGYWSD